MEAFFHRLEQRRLHLGGRPIDFVGNDNMMEQRAGLKTETAVMGPVYIGPGQVRR